MHSWAQDVEDISADLGINYRQDGQAVYQEYMKNLSIVHNAYEQGSPVPAGLPDSLRNQRGVVAELVRRHMEGES